MNAMLADQFPGAAASCAELGDTWALASSVVPGTAIRPGGYVSGPTQFALADAALWYMTFAVIGRIEPMALTSELSIRFLRPAQGELVWARARDTALDFYQRHGFTVHGPGYVDLTTNLPHHDIIRRV